MDAFLQGVIAGYGIAIPVGAIAILIVEAGLRRGFASGFAAGAGAATADLVYAALAAIAGQALAALLAPYADILRLVSGLVLVVLGAYGIWQLRRERTATTDQDAAVPAAPWKTYTRFVGLTLLNPLTITYFAALILGGNTLVPTWGARLSFVLGAALASLSWQSLLAGVGALAHRHLSPQFRVITSLLGNLIVIGLGVRLFF